MGETRLEKYPEKPYKYKDLLMGTRNVLAAALEDFRVMLQRREVPGIVNAPSNEVPTTEITVCDLKRGYYDRLCNRPCSSLSEMYLFGYHYPTVRPEVGGAFLAGFNATTTSQYEGDLAYRLGELHAISAEAFERDFECGFQVGFKGERLDVDAFYNSDSPEGFYCGHQWGVYLNRHTNDYDFKRDVSYRNGLMAGFDDKPLEGVRLLAQKHAINYYAGYRAGLKLRGPTDGDYGLGFSDAIHGKTAISDSDSYVVGHTVGERVKSLYSVGMRYIE